MLLLAPDFLGTAQPGFETSARLVALCGSTALAGGELTKDERSRLVNAHQTAMYLLAGQQEPAGAARWWIPVLDRIGVSESFYRNFVATEHAAEAVAVTARVTDDVRLRGLLKRCLAAVRRSREVDAFVDG